MIQFNTTAELLFNCKKDNNAQTKEIKTANIGTPALLQYVKIYGALPSNANQYNDLEDH